MKLKAIIVDDEPLARKVMQKYCNDLPGIEVIAECKDALEAMEILQNTEVDLVFLDINMPKISGIDFVKSMAQKPMIIFTTAYPEYAVQGFELEAVDYLVKPIEFERFIKACNKCITLKSKNSSDQNTDTLFVKSDRKLIKLALGDILYVQAYGDYIKIHTNDKIILSKDKLSNIEQSLPKNTFIRVHRSYIVHLNAIDYLEGKHVKIKDAVVPISDSNMENLMSRLKTSK
jgi:DNA-binding LytR/AlgR family response regulator